ncbi:DUF5318 family protein [Corynebacterium sp. 13CS0277]|uniref:DUF5318 family protein n=1 Tax=Corynebacterium sp. 13CS0277 TaxID=2071994 RepID=UPI001304FA9B
MTDVVEINYEWQRRNTIRLYREGALRRDDLCDADPLLITASEYHGQPAAYPCPICGSLSLRTVSWVYGDNIKGASGSARSAEERQRLAADGSIFTTHVVEVCPECRWNHLLRATTPDDSRPAGTVPAPAHKVQAQHEMMDDGQQPVGGNGSERSAGSADGERDDGSADTTAAANDPATADTDEASTNAAVTPVPSPLAPPTPFDD